MRLHCQIEQFYGERKGLEENVPTLIFSLLRSEAYLTEEEEVLLEAMMRGYSRLVEVGCGYGRYLNWAVSRGYDYLGLDIVPWLVELGQLRIANARKQCTVRRRLPAFSCTSG